MKLLVIVTVLVTCGPITYNEFFKFLKPWDGHYVETSWFTWISGIRINNYEAKRQTSDQTQRQNVNSSEIESLSNETTQFFKYAYSDVVPDIPGDNSHYVEGHSRYIWMPDGNGVPHLVDLLEEGRPGFEERAVSDTEYWLYTRRNPHIPQELVLYQASTISSDFHQRPVIIIVHGWLSDGHDGFSTLMLSTFLSVQDVNFIIVDWRNLAKGGYGTSVQAVPEVGRHIATFLSWLVDTSGASWDSVHLIGFSLGAHIAGSAGRFTGGKPARITGLDPAGPLFHGNPDNLSPADGQYVEVIHTDGDRLGHFGRLGQADFYVNGGRNPQPGCFISTCSHSRVVELFAATVRFNHLSGYRCANIPEGICSGVAMKMGNAILTKRGYGVYCVKTEGTWPY